MTPLQKISKTLRELGLKRFIKLRSIESKTRSNLTIQISIRETKARIPEVLKAIQGAYDPKAVGLKLEYLDESLEARARKILPKLLKESQEPLYVGPYKVSKHPDREFYGIVGPEADYCFGNAEQTALSLARYLIHWEDAGS